MIETAPSITETWGTDTQVLAVANLGDTVIIGGTFSRVGRLTGGGTQVDRLSGAFAGPTPKVSGTIMAVVSDGKEGWFIGGSFSAVGGLERRNLAHILSGGRVSPWAPNPDGSVRALALDDRTLYVGGDFSTIAGRTRSCLAAFETNFGRLTGWNPHVSGVGFLSTEVTAIAVGRDRVFVGGDFAAIGTESRLNLASIGSRSGRAFSWNPDPDARVEALVLAGQTLYVGGEFSHVAGVFRRSAAAIDATTAAVTGWNPDVQNTVPDDGYDTTVSSMALCQERMVLGGHFSLVGDAIRGGLAEVDLDAGKPLPWNPNPIDPSALITAPFIYAVLGDGPDVLIGGLISGLGGIARDNAAAVDAVTGELRSWNPGPDRAVHAFAAARDRVYVGGEFGIIQTVPRGCLAAFDIKRGSLLEWRHDVLGFFVDALSVLGSKLYCGGYFFSIDGQDRAHVAAFDMNGGRLLDWNPLADGPVSSVAATDGGVFLAGQFQHVGGATRSYVAAVDAATGYATTWAPLVDDIVNVVLPRDSTVFLGGWFTSVNGAQRARLAAINTSGDVIPWDPSGCGPVLSMAATKDTVFAAGSFNSDGLCSYGVAAFDQLTGARAWIAPADAHVNALTCDSQTVYVGGSFTRVSGEARGTLAALSRQGRVLDWGSASDGVVWTLAVVDGTICAGGSFEHLGLEPRANIAALAPFACGGAEASGGTCASREVALTPENPAGSNPAIRFMLRRPQVVSIEIYDLQGRVVAVPIRHELRPAGQQVVVIHAEDWPDGFYFCRLVTDETEVARKFLIVR